jgi:polysaccharide biosynthesis protein PslH
LQSRPQLLFLTQVLPYPLDAGPKIRAYYTLRHLSQHFRITLVSFVRATDSTEAVAHLQEFCETLLTVPIRRDLIQEGLAMARSFWQNESFLILRDQLALMTTTIRSVIHKNHFSFVHADQLSMAYYALAAQKYAGELGQSPKVVLDQHNAFYLIPQRMAKTSGNPLTRWWWRREAQNVARYEAQVCRQFDKVVTVTEDDRRALLALYSAASSTPALDVIPICIDLESTQPVTTLNREPTLLFIGGMHWPPNADGITWFVQEVLPILQKRLPALQLIVIGKSPPAALARAAASVMALGFVASTEPYWPKARAYIVPLRVGGGMRVKILEAWAHAVPVISTTIGAEGIDYDPSTNILIGDTPEALASAVLNVLLDEELANVIGRGGRSAAEQYYDWREIYRAWDSIYV